MEYEKCERCGTIKAFYCKHCGVRIHPYYSGTLSGSGGFSPFWRDDADEFHCELGSAHYPVSQEPEEMTDA